MVVKKIFIRKYSSAGRYFYVTKLHMWHILHISPRLTCLSNNFFVTLASMTSTETVNCALRKPYIRDITIFATLICAHVNETIPAKGNNKWNITVTNCFSRLSCNKFLIHPLQKLVLIPNMLSGEILSFGIRVVPRHKLYNLELWGHSWYHRTDVKRIWGICKMLSLDSVIQAQLRFMYFCFAPGMHVMVKCVCMCKYSNNASFSSS